MTLRDFQVNVAQIRRSAGSDRRVVVRTPMDADDLDMEVALPLTVVPDGAEVGCDVVVQSFQGGIMVTGTVEAPWQGTCRRCTVPVEGNLAVHVRTRFVDEATARRDHDDEAYLIVDDVLDLWPMVHDAVVLDLPAAPLCGPDCKGLCPACGCDRNTDSCDCVAPSDPRWASLDVLRAAN